MILTYKYRLKHPSYGRRLRRHASALNQVWNYDVALHRKLQRSYREGAPKQLWPSEYDLNRLTAGTSKDLAVHAGSIHEINRFFAQSRNRARRAPKFRKSFGSKRALGWVPFRQSDRKISAGAVRFFGKTYRWFCDRPLPTTVKDGAFVEDSSGRWWVCLHVEVVDSLPTGTGEIGIDLGLTNLATTSGGKKIKAPQFYRRFEIELATAQRAGNRARVRAIHRKIKNSRIDYLHKMSAQLAADNRLIIVGDVRPIQHVSRHAKSITDIGWSTFRTQLRYKASRHGAVYREVDERFTTQTCSSCGARPPERPKGIAGLGIREWRCSACGATHDRDVNAARNILALGLSDQPREDEIGQAEKTRGCGDSAKFDRPPRLSVRSQA